MSLEFQIYDWSEDHEETLDSDDDGSSEEEGPLEYIIHTFGRTLDGKSVYMKIKDYLPYFYIKLPNKWDMSTAKNNMKQMQKALKKEYKIWQKYRNYLVKISVVEKKIAEGFTNDKKFLFGKLIFNNSMAMKNFKKYFELNKLKSDWCNKYSVNQKKIYYKTYEANLQPMLRCFHNMNVSGCSWVQINKYNEMKIEKLKESHCDIEISVYYKNIIPIIKEFNAPLRILSFDIECNSKDGGFPLAFKKHDPIIQIGSTYTYLGHSKPYRQHIVCLKDTSDVDNVLVECCNTERELILKWIKELVENDCDIITGYNIFWFDEAYIRDRCKIHLGLEEEICKISKLKNKICRYRNFKLASSAMGENRIKMFNTPGRVHIDLMKDVQKTYNLSSYKLDSVASHFIRDKILKIEKCDNGYKLYCSGIDDIYIDDYIHIELVYEFISDYIGNKYNIIDIDSDNKTIIITANGELDCYLDKIESNVTLFWSQAKDDVGPKDIFNYWMNGNADDRAIVAKYCIKDCRLVNLLVNKLEVVTKNIEMSNVCFVPLSFLFVRGQGIKGFSLCTKVYQDEGFVFPVLYKQIKFKDNEEGETISGEVIYSKSQFNSEGEITDDPETLSIKLKSSSKTKIVERKSDKIIYQANGGYEGAIVFEPEASVYHEALAVKDYASLYPSSIIQKNMSHETKVINEKYDNLPGVKYYNAEFKNEEGKLEYKRFAQVDGKLGVVPQILSTLLSERKRVKKLMKKESDPFKKKILDAKQLALKITANSLYGCFGASVSSIKDKDIAACTTSTGREMLIFAKKYDEEIVPGILNGLKYAYKMNDMETVKSILDKEHPNRTEEFETKIKDFVTNKLDKIIFQPIIRYGDTDSIFTCYRFRKSCKKVSDSSVLKLWKEMIAFSETLIGYFIPIEFKSLWEECHQKYYRTELITDLSLPVYNNIPKIPESNKDTVSIDDAFVIFLTEYMEEIFIPWLWTLQDIYNKDYVVKENLNTNLNTHLYMKIDNLMNKLFLLTDKHYIYDNDYSEEKLNHYHNVIEPMIRNFIETRVKNYYIQPYYTVTDDNKYKVNVKFYKEGEKILNKTNLILSVNMGVITGELVKSRLPFPHDLEYEKTYWPFLILTKKRYVGNKYEFDCDKYKQDFMGIVLKRRDNAPIVKEICNGIINCLLNHNDASKAVQYIIKCLDNMFNNKYDIKYFLTSKTLKMKSSYVDWTRIGHAVLADRIAQRSPGNCPQSGDRIQYAAIKVANPEKKKMLQGDRIETPEHILSNNLEIDYRFYVTNQIMKPSLQFLNLVILDAKKVFVDYLDKVM
uniref:DNA polymerase n=1 Tax=Megaviridae environmental sample TaxID=1737588 RepID=A0A5J6VMT0_9VIRU|nr:MAG: DNA polymerase family B [Megaviridae environmental sample]